MVSPEIDDWKQLMDMLRATLLTPFYALTLKFGWRDEL
jgi:hypothetical protein